MHSQSWVATLIFTVIAFGGGFLAGMHDVPAVVNGQEAPVAGLQAAAYFSPQGGCTRAIIDQIGAAGQTIELQGYTLSSPAIVDALIAARRRGVRVTILLDAVQTSEHRDQPRRLLASEVPVFLDAKHGTADNRVILIDNRTLITGSFNFTESAEVGNAENLLVIHDQPQLQSSYEENFRMHLRHSAAYDGG